jgi:hypothetical protein
MTTQLDPIMQRLPSSMRAAYAKSQERFYSATVNNMKFGDPAGFEPLTPEARMLKMFAEQAQRTWREVHDTHWGAMADVTATEGARLVRSATAAKAKLKAIDAHFENVVSTAERELAVLKPRIDSALRPPHDSGSALLESEIRAHVRGLKPEAAAQLLKDDPAVRKAVITGPAFLSGVRDMTWAQARKEHLEATVGDVLAKHDNLVAAVQMAATAGTYLEREARGLIDFATADALATPSQAA